MLIVVSPAKTLDFDTPAGTERLSQPQFVEHSQKLINKLSKLSRKKIGEMMSISKSLVELNHGRFQSWGSDGNPEKQAIYAFKGDVYLGLKAELLDEEDLAFAQDHLRILSGLYGYLRPLDLMEPYRLEMGTSLKVGRRDNLYKFWGDKLPGPLREDLDNQGDNILINLASNEYFDAIDLKKLKARVINVSFKDEKNGVYKFISFWGKKARGMMTRYIIQNRISDPEGLKGFTEEGYVYNEELSSGDEMVFTRAEGVTA